MKTIENFDFKFQKLIKEMCPANKYNTLIITDSGLACYKEQNGLVPIGCPVCIDYNLGQNEMGNPTLNSQDLIHSQTMKKNYPDFPNLPMEVESNLWFCPNCKLPISKLIPNFNNLDQKE